MGILTKKEKDSSGLVIPDAILKAKQELEDMFTMRAGIAAEIEKAKNAIAAADTDSAEQKQRLATGLANGTVSADQAGSDLRNLSERKELFALTVIGLEKKLKDTDAEVARGYKALYHARTSFGQQLTVEFQKQAASAVEALKAVFNRSQAVAMAFGISLPGIEKSHVYDPADINVEIYSSSSPVFKQGRFEYEPTFMKDPDCVALFCSLEPFKFFEERAKTEADGYQQRSIEDRAKKQKFDEAARIAAAKKVFGTLAWESHSLADPLVEAELAKNPPQYVQ